MKKAVASAVLALSFTWSCTRDSEAPSRGHVSPTPAPGVAATITGTVRFRGEPPAPTPLRMTADCGGNKSGVDVKVQNGRIENAFVYVRDGLGDLVFERPKEPVVIDQQGCLFLPRVVGLQSGQPLEFLNSDPTLHNVHTTPAKSSPANFGLGVRGAKRTITIPNSEVMVSVKCDVHPWMRAYVGVVDHPFFAVTGPDGAFRLEHLPPGTYEVEAWHERLGRKSVSVKVGPGDSADIEIAIP